MDREFELHGLGKGECLKATILRRQCPFYEHAWYAEEANWIVARIEIWARPFTGSFTTVFHINDLLKLRAGLSRSLTDRDGGFSAELNSHDSNDSLKIRARPSDQELLYASFD